MTRLDGFAALPVIDVANPGEQEACGLHRTLPAIRGSRASRRPSPKALSAT
jgi:hypothetical protein